MNLHYNLILYDSKFMHQFVLLVKSVCITDSIPPAVRPSPPHALLQGPSVLYQAGPSLGLESQTAMCSKVSEALSPPAGMKNSSHCPKQGSRPVFPGTLCLSSFSSCRCPPEHGYPFCSETSGLLSHPPCNTPWYPHHASNVRQ